jgi:hypothetical protein
VDAKCFIGNLRRNQKFLAFDLQIKTSIRKSRIWTNILSEQKAKYQTSKNLSGLVRNNFQRRTLRFRMDIVSTLEDCTNDRRPTYKCGPGQPPEPHCFGGNPAFPFPRTRHGLSRIALPALRRVRARRRLASFQSRSELREATCSTTVASSQSCRVWRTLEEAATPGQPVRAETRFLEEPS